MLHAYYIVTTCLCSPESSTLSRLGKEAWSAQTTVPAFAGGSSSREACDAHTMQ